MKNNMRPFESIASSLEFMVLLESVIKEASADLRERLPGAEDKRYRDGITLALYKIQQLSDHVQKSRRILNDLSMIRALLMGHSETGVTARTSALALGRSIDESQTGNESQIAKELSRQ